MGKYEERVLEDLDFARMSSFLPESLKSQILDWPHDSCKESPSTNFPQAQLPFSFEISESGISLPLQSD